MSLHFRTNEDFLEKMRALVGQGITPSSMCQDRLKALGYTVCRGATKKLHLRYLGRDLLIGSLSKPVRELYLINPQYYFPGLELPWQNSQASGK